MVSCYCTNEMYDDFCGACDWGRITYGPGKVTVYLDSRSQLTHDGLFLCAKCALPDYPFTLELQ